MRHTLAALLLIVFASCSDDRESAADHAGADAATPPDGGSEGSVDAALDAALDAQLDALLDANEDGSAPLGWQAPIGVPIPEFGIHEQAPPVPEPWSSTQSGWYYICPACSGATDEENSNGHPQKPRRTIPTLPAGSVAILDGQHDIDQSFVANGTATAPVFVRGQDSTSPPLLTERQQIAGSYVIVENLHYGPLDGADQSFGVHVPEGSHQIAIRNCELSGNQNRAGGIGIGSWSYTGDQSASQIVIDGCWLHDIGDVSASSDQDAHCIVLNGSADHVWVTHNTLERCSGDGIQIEARTGRRDKVHHVYFGLNHSRHHRQAGAWIKHASDVIFSENVLHGFSANSGGPGACTGFQYGPEQVWILYNELYDCPIGVNMADNDPPGDGQNQYVIGNVIHDIHGADGANAYNQGGIIARGGTHVALLNNTIDSADSGINILPFSGDVVVRGNIVSNRRLAGTHNFDLSVASAGILAALDENLFFAADGVRFLWAGSSLTSVNALASASSACMSCLAADPEYVSPESADYRLAAGSPAIDAGTESAAYAAFETRYGLSIAVDADRRPRPAGSGWDLGAYER